MDHRSILIALVLFIFLFNINITKGQNPPFSGTIFLDPDIVTSEDPTTFLELTEAGKGVRTMFDRRVNDWITVEAYLFNAQFDDGLSMEIQVNPEFGSTEAALKEAERYAPKIGQLSTVLRKNAETVWIHKGMEPFGGGNNNILIHTGQAVLYEEDGILEETLIHESSHTSLDDPHAQAADWIAAQAADPTFISTYAQDNATREDIAESFLLYIALRYRSDRIDEELKKSIMETIPNRIAYFDKQMFDMYPIGLVSSTKETDPLAPSMSLSPNPFKQKTVITFELSKSATIQLDLINLKGQVIQQIIPVGLQVAGKHQIELNTFDQAKGLYLVRLQTGGKLVFKKVVLL